MFQRILVPVDGSETSGLALATAIALARESGGSLRIVHLFDALAWLTGFEVGTQALDQARSDAGRIVDAASMAARAAGVDADGRLLDLPGQRLGEVVADAARAFGADLVVVGSVGRRGLGRVLLGSGAEQVVRLAAAPVLVVRPPGRRPEVA